MIWLHDDGHHQIISENAPEEKCKLVWKGIAIFHGKHGGCLIMVMRNWVPARQTSGRMFCGRLLAAHQVLVANYYGQYFGSSGQNGQNKKSLIRIAC